MDNIPFTYVKEMSSTGLLDVLYSVCPLYIVFVTLNSSD